MAQGEKTYNLKEVRQIISQKDEANEPVPFSIQASTCDLKRGTKSEIIEIQYATLFSQKYELLHLMVMAKSELTRQLVPTGNIRAVHLSLITEINNIEVQWT